MSLHVDARHTSSHGTDGYLVLKARHLSGRKGQELRPSSTFVPQVQSQAVSGQLSAGGVGVQQAQPALGRGSRDDSPTHGGVLPTRDLKLEQTFGHGWQALVAGAAL